MDEVKSSLADLKVQITALDMKLDGFGSNYVTRNEFEMFKANRWLTLFLTVLVSSAITGLISFFLIHK